AAEACLLGSRKGRLARGHDADILVAAGNPFYDVGDLRRGVAVYREGERVDPARGWSRRIHRLRPDSGRNGVLNPLDFPASGPWQQQLPYREECATQLQAATRPWVDEHMEMRAAVSPA